MQLSEHFSLSEFTRSATAAKYGIDNTFDPSNPAHAEIIANLRNLCEQVLEPLRAFASQPIIISSGYRSPALNRAVGGAKNSQHLTGEAVDIRIPMHAFVNEQGQRFTNMELLNRWFDWMTNNCDFDQLIKETANRRTYWIHVSCKRNRRKNRHQSIRFLLKGDTNARAPAALRLAKRGALL